MAYFSSYPSMGMPTYGSPMYSQPPSYGSFPMMPSYAPATSYPPAAYPPAYPASYAGSMQMPVYSQPAYQPYNPYGVYYQQQQAFQPYGGYYLPWGMYGGWSAMGLPFDPHSFVLPNAISGYGAGAGTVSFPGIRFDQGEQLVSRMAGAYSRERMSLYQSVPARDSGRESAAELYRSADLARPSSIAPGSPPAQFPDEPAPAATSFLSSLLPASMRSTTASTPAQEAPAIASLPPAKPKAASARHQDRPKSGSVSSVPGKAAPSPPPRTGSPLSVASMPLGGDAKGASVTLPRASSVTGVPPAKPKGGKAAPAKQLCGVGLLFSREKEGGRPAWIVRKVIAGSPAGESGLVQLGDELTSVDGTKVGKMESMFEISKCLLGAEGTTTTLRFDRKGDVYSVPLLRSNTFIGSEGNSSTSKAVEMQEETMEV
mmetsp:Transcript_51907/g.129158  ORF Transcript_51907/g.129158 Transcript_51907/m.129158 type:complete len:429 (-) Transcript_51907:86-1372(-)